ncbi:MAG: Uma2 family endonuclease [Egibacteraceae bacterium]
MTEGHVRPLRRTEYDLLVEQDVFGDERIQLLEGELVAMSPQKAPHAGIVEALNERLMPALVGKARVRVQLPMAAGEHSEPEPDIAVVPAGEPRDRHPERALLVIEVADSSLSLDLVRKPGIYAAAGVPVYWVIDLAGDVVHVHTDPVGEGYASVTRHGANETLDACGVSVTLRDLRNA